MKKVRDQITAQRLLKIRREGITWYGYLLKYYWFYILLYALSVSAVFLWAHAFQVSRLSFYALLFFAAGLCTGVVLRDIRWMRSIQMNWPFTLKTTHWEMIEKMAKGETTES
jgi:hypothetical protein